MVVNVFLVCIVYCEIGNTKKVNISFYSSALFSNVSKIYRPFSVEFVLPSPCQTFATFAYLIKYICIYYFFTSYRKVVEISTHGSVLYGRESTNLESQVYILAKLDDIFVCIL